MYLSSSEATEREVRLRLERVCQTGWVQDTHHVIHYHPGGDFIQRQLDRKLEFLPSQIIHYLQQHLNKTDKGSVIRA